MRRMGSLAKVGAGTCRAGSQLRLGKRLWGVGLLRHKWAQTLKQPPCPPSPRRMQRLTRA
jgi:hypothetical protein